MPAYRIYRIKENASQHFRWAAHVAGASQAKRKDYDEGALVEAANEYAAWLSLRDSESPLKVGDLLEAEDGRLKICKYVGFDSAQWILPELKTGLESAPAASGPVQSNGELLL